MTPPHLRRGDCPVEVLPTREGYDRWSEIYDTEGNPLIALEEPHVRLLLGDVRGLAVADVGCGTGRHAVALAARGARVTAVDFSDGMMAKARTKNASFPVRFAVADLTQPLPFSTGAFDGLVCGLVLDHIENLSSLLGELRRICRPGGFAVISNVHPAMLLCGVEAHFTDPRTGREIRPRSVPNSISDYVMASLAAGWTLQHLSEHAVNQDLSERMPRAAKYLGWPLLLMMRLRNGSRFQPEGPSQDMLGRVESAQQVE